MTKTFKTIATMAMGAMLASGSPAMAAGYLKLGDIKGESTEATADVNGQGGSDVIVGPGAGSPNRQKAVKAPQSEAQAALLLPAVQKVREAAAR